MVSGFCHSSALSKLKMHTLFSGTVCVSVCLLCFPAVSIFWELGSAEHPWQLLKWAGYSCAMACESVSHVLVLRSRCRLTVTVYWGKTQVCPNPLSLNPVDLVPMAREGQAQLEDEPQHAVAGCWSAGSVQQDPGACQGMQGSVSTDTDTQNVRTHCSRSPGFLWSRWEFAWVRYTLKWNRSIRFWPVRTWVSIENASLLKS